MTEICLATRPPVHHQRRLRHAPFKRVGLALALAALQSPAWALDYTWNGSGGFWDEAGKWSLLGVPGSDDTATINSTGTNTLIVRDPRSVGTLYKNGGFLASTSTLSVGTLHFGGGYFGSSAAASGGVMNVTGSASFNGSEVQDISYSHIINLGGNASWTQGNGRLAVAAAYTQGATAFAASALNIGAGTTFTDQGAATADGYKIIGGGEMNIAGTYLRTGPGTTYARGLNITGTLDIASGNLTFDSNHWTNTSSGLVKVAAGSTLGLANMTFTQGSVVNLGLVKQIGGNVTVAAAAQIGGAWQVDAGQMSIEGTHTVDSLVMNGHQLTGPGVLNTGSLVYNSGKFGGQGTANGSGLNVSGPAIFNGTNTLDIDYNYAVNLAGDSRWTAGNGRLVVAQDSSSGPAAVLNIGAGSTFTDEGAASASGVKVLRAVSALSFNNAGTYVRTGLGTTEATGFNNTGTLKLAAGVFLVDAGFSNTGHVEVSSGALLAGYQPVLVNAGLLTGTGIVRTFRPGDALVSSGSIAPGSAIASARGINATSTATSTSLGMLAIDGGLSLTDSAVLHIDLASGGASDLLAINGAALWNGELSVWADEGMTLQLGEVYTIATFGQRLGGSTFDSISWHGLSADQFAVEYGSNNITLRVTAVPEPASYALMGLGLLLIAGRKLRKQGSGA